MHKKNNLTQYVLTWKTLQEILLTEKNKVHMLHSWFSKQIYLCIYRYLYTHLSVYVYRHMCVLSNTHAHGHRISLEYAQKTNQSISDFRDERESEARFRRNFTCNHILCIFLNFCAMCM